MATKAATTKKPSASRKTASTKAKVTKTTAVVSRATARKTVAASSGFSGDFKTTIKSVSFWRSLVAEVIGTFLLAAVIIVGQGQPLYTLFALIGIVLLVGTVSGSYLNPALAIASWATRRISWLRAIGYIIAEVIGALLAYLAISFFVGGADATSYGTTDIFKANAITSGKEWYVLVSELLGTAIVGFAFANALRASQDRLTKAFTYGAGFFIALMVAFIASSYVSATAILNPAVAFSLQAVNWSWFPIAVYVLAPIVGGVVGFVINDLVKGRDK